MSNWVTLSNGVHIDLDDPHNPITGDGTYEDYLGKGIKDTTASKESVQEAEKEANITSVCKPLVDPQTKGYKEKIDKATDEMVEKNFKKEILVERFGVTEEELKTFYEYTDGGNKNDFSVKWNEINDALNKEGKEIEDLTPEQQEWLKRLDAAVNKCEIPQDISLYRGIHLSLEQIEKLGIMKVGETFTTKGMFSTSSSKQTAKSFARAKEDEISVLMTIHVRKGTHGCCVKDVAHRSAKRQNEFLFGLNTKCNVLMTEKSGNKIYITCEMQKR